VTVKGEGIVEADGMEDGFQLMETIGAFSKDVEEEVDLAG
jgi:hypothetical protein